MSTKLSHPSPLENLKSRKVFHWLFDSMTEAADTCESNNQYSGEGNSDGWCGGHNWRTALNVARKGDLSGVAASDALLEEMEYPLATERRTWEDAMAGAIPNVPAFIAGRPLAMRRKIRAASDAAPIAIIADLSTSGSIDAKQARRRGAAILALVRALSQRRPIELWVTAGLDANYGEDAGFISVRIDTAPLDLAHAAHALTHVGFPRRILYGLAKEFGFSGQWPFNSHRALTRSEMEACFAPAFAHASETLCLPGIHGHDESLTNPQEWLRKQIEAHDPVRLAEAS